MDTPNSFHTDLYCYEYGDVVASPILADPEADSTRRMNAPQSSQFVSIAVEAQGEVNGILDQFQGRLADINDTFERKLVICGEPTMRVQERKRSYQELFAKKNSMGSLPTNAVQNKRGRVFVPGIDRKPSRPRKRLPEEAVQVLSEWFEKHIDNPYPSDDDKAELAKRSKLTLVEVQNWFMNRRKRCWKPGSSKRTKKGKASTRDGNGKKAARKVETCGVRKLQSRKARCQDDNDPSYPAPVAPTQGGSDARRITTRSHKKVTSPEVEDAAVSIAQSTTTSRCDNLCLGIASKSGSAEVGEVRTLASATDSGAPPRTTSEDTVSDMVDVEALRMDNNAEERWLLENAENSTRKSDEFLSFLDVHTTLQNRVSDSCLLLKNGQGSGVRKKRNSGQMAVEIDLQFVDSFFDSEDQQWTFAAPSSNDAGGVGRGTPSTSVTGLHALFGEAARESYKGLTISIESSVADKDPAFNAIDVSEDKSNSQCMDFVPSNFSTPKASLSYTRLDAFFESAEELRDPTCIGQEPTAGCQSGVASMFYNHAQMSLLSDSSNATQVSPALTSMSFTENADQAAETEVDSLSPSADLDTSFFAKLFA